MKKRITLGIWLMSADRKEYNKMLKEKGIKARILYDKEFVEQYISTSIEGTDDDIRTMIIKELNIK